MRTTSKWALVSNVLVLASGLALSGCGGEPPDELDPASALGGDEWLDDGPPPGEEAVDEEVGSTSEGVSDMPAFQLPFPCGQVWAGQTRTNHSPQNSVDFNRNDDIGDAVVASAGGKITRVANEGNTSYGRWIEIDHGNGYRSRYAHLNSQVVSVGQSVSKGQKIGTVGNTGGSTGPHLHYEVRRNGVAIRPVFNGATAYFYGTKNYTSKNSCSGSGGGGTSVVGTVNTNGVALTVRADASTSSAAVGSVADGAKVTITCQKQGTSVTGTYGTSTLWDFIGNGYVSDAYVSTGSDGQVAPTCK
ncbi:peptidoglycan DD-metalloendopeptidase family protein [Polyangium jinanense]|uniref:Peptidoglycan DD-metalloendopeptidase family protein n=1 Tax=Polyangium jinanense TaxID=2829994 RepID=A0A9X3X3Q3_9BACT|nr:peptidoglycan DD-metalloendopeptidase family protein [Polyangium jinanense]MDC3955332.1 peptidoglycan DD-metalloendopeptidase family protein [Polyangium jinanense]MDC3981633.1 peptidoglycan DD-metalloendopeptidase family protein [Polyangium jinanense]